MATAIASPLRLVCLTTNDTSAAPKTLPSIIAGRAALTVLGPDQVKLSYDTVGAYAWDTIPYVDQSVAWTHRRGIDRPTVETLSWLKTGKAFEAAPRLRGAPKNDGLEGSQDARHSGFYLR